MLSLLSDNIRGVVVELEPEKLEYNSHLAGHNDEFD